jgi:hypothetical protein
MPPRVNVTEVVIMHNIHASSFEGKEQFKLRLKRRRSKF